MVPSSVLDEVALYHIKGNIHHNHDLLELRFIELIFYFFLIIQLKKCPHRPPEAPTVLYMHSSFLSQAQLSFIPNTALSYPKHSSCITCAQDIKELCGIGKNSAGIRHSELPEVCRDIIATLGPNLQFHLDLKSGMS